MLRCSLALAIAMCASACLDGGTIDEPTSDGGLTLADDTHAQITTELAIPDDSYNICDHLPDTAPCSLLCDRDALADQYVPENTCVVFVCTLTDGRAVSVHACHHPP